MNVLIDTNVILDFLLKRGEFYQSAARINVLSEKGFIQGFVSASAITDIFYIVNKELNNKSKTLSLISNLLTTVRIAAVMETTIHEALNINWNDFEDAIQYIAGKSISAEYIITRNPKDFVNSLIKVIEPKEFITIFTA